MLCVMRVYLCMNACVICGYRVACILCMDVYVCVHCVCVCVKVKMPSPGKRWVVESRMLLRPESHKYSLGRGRRGVTELGKTGSSRSSIVSFFCGLDLVASENITSLYALSVLEGPTSSSQRSRNLPPPAKCGREPGWEGWLRRAACSRGRMEDLVCKGS